MRHVCSKVLTREPTEPHQARHSDFVGHAASNWLLLEPPLQLLVPGFAPAAAHAVAIGVAFALITGLHIVFGELAPKGLALQRPEVTTLWVARPIQLFHAVFKWPISALNWIGNGALKIVGLEPASGHEMVHSVEELRLLVTGMQRAGVVDVAEARIAQRAFAFGELTAGALMTPRTELEAVSVTTEAPELFRVAETTRFSRLPVYEGSLDQVIGIVHVRDLFRHRNTPPSAFSLRALAQSPLLVPEAKYAAELLEEMRTRRCHVAIVVDEYGGTAGMITLRDLMEALVGRIEDGPATAGDVPISDGRCEPDGSMLLDGLLRVEEFEELAGIRLSEGELQDGIETIGGLIPAILGRFPDVGEDVRIGGRWMRVESRDGLRIATVRLLPRRVGAASTTGT